MINGGILTFGFRSVSFVCYPWYIVLRNDHDENSKAVISQSDYRSITSSLPRSQGPGVIHWLLVLRLDWRDLVGLMNLGLTKFQNFVQSCQSLNWDLISGPANLRLFGQETVHTQGSAQPIKQWTNDLTNDHFSDITVRMAPSCDELRRLPVRWIPGELAHFSLEPKFVGWTDVTIMGITPTSSVPPTSSSIETGKLSW